MRLFALMKRLQAGMGKGRDTEDGEEEMATKKDVRLGDRRRDEAVVQSLSPGKTGPVLPRCDSALPCRPANQTN